MKKLWVENIQLHPAVSYSEQAPDNNFIDKNDDMIAWDQYGSIVLDYDRYRYIIKLLFYAAAGDQLQNFANLTLAEKEIGARYFFIPYALRLNYVTDEQDYNNWANLLDLTQGLPTYRYIGRAKTFDEMRKIVADAIRTETLTLAQTQQLYKDVRNMADWFIKTNAPDLKQWIMNEVGTPYENNGFAQTPYYSLALRDKLYDIYNGNY